MFSVRPTLIWETRATEDNASMVMTQIGLPRLGGARNRLPTCLVHGSNFAAVATNPLVAGDRSDFKTLNPLVDVVGCQMIRWGPWWSSC